MESLLGRELERRSEDGTSTVKETNEAIASAELVAVFFGDGVLQSSQNAATALQQLADEVNDGAHERLAVVFVGEDRIDDATARLLERTGFWVPRPFQGATDRVRSTLRLPLAMILPEVLLLDKFGQLVATDGKRAIEQGSWKVDSFPSWRTNVFRVRSSNRVGGQAAFLEPEAALQAGFYPGDLIKVRSDAASIYVWLNPPPSEEAEDREADGADDPDDSADIRFPRVPDDPACILLSDVARRNLKVDRDAAVTIDRANVPDAHHVTVRPCACSPAALVWSEVSSSSVLADVLHPYFGLDSGEKAESLCQLVADAEGSEGGRASASSSGIGDWLAQFVTERECRRRPLRPAEVFLTKAPEEWQLRAREGRSDEEDEGAWTWPLEWCAWEVVTVHPRGAGVVGPGTKLAMEPPPLVEESQRELESKE